MKIFSEISFTISKEDLIKGLQESITEEDTGKVQINLKGVENLLTSYSQKCITPDDYYQFDKLIKKNQINLKDIRNIIIMASVWWSYGPICSNDTLIKHYLMRKEEFREKVYSGELITLTLDALSVAKDPVSNFYSRLRGTNPENYPTFEDFYKAMYTDDPDQ